MAEIKNDNAAPEDKPETAKVKKQPLYFGSLFPFYIDAILILSFYRLPFFWDLSASWHWIGYFDRRPGDLFDASVHGNRQYRKGA